MAGERLKRGASAETTAQATPRRAGGAHDVEPVADPPTAGDPSDVPTASIGTSGERDTRERDASDEPARDVLPPRFRAKRVIGKGGMGIVYEAHDLAIDRDVAVKVMSREAGADPSVRARFLREARAAGSLRHPGIVTVHDVDANACLIVMELIEGESLHQRLRREKPLPTEEVRRIGLALLDALAAAHDAAIVHRDIKPANILVATGGAIKVVDFGVASFGDSDLTSTGVRIGTPAYMAPEQLRGRSVDRRSDIYSVGATLFEAATGRRLHETDAHVDVHAVVLDATHDESLARAIARAVRERAAERFADAREFAAALRGDRVDEPAMPNTPSIDPPPTRGRERARRFAAACAIAITIAAGAFAIVRARDGRVTATATSAAASSSPLAAHDPQAVRKLAVLPFDVRSPDPKLDFARSGLPYVLEQELASASALTLIDHYRLRETVAPESAASIDAWRAAAKAAGAGAVVRGELAPAARGVRVIVALEELSTGKTLDRVEREVAVEDVIASVRSLATVIAAVALGDSNVQVPRGADHSFAVERELQIGIEALRAHDFPRAERHLRAAVALDDTLADAHYHLAILSWWREQSHEATRAEIERALAGTTSVSRRGVLQGLELFLDADFVAAITHFKALAAEHPDDADILYGWSEALFHGGRPADAIVVYRHLLEVAPHHGLGLLHPLEYFLAHADEAGYAWAAPYTGPADSVNRRMWDARAAFARRDFPTARDAMRAILDTATPSDEITYYARADLLIVYAVMHQVDTARSLAGNAGIESLRYALALVDGDLQAAARLRDSAERVAEASGEHRIKAWTTLVSIDAPRADARRARALLARLDAAGGRSATKSVGVAVSRAMLAGVAQDAALLEEARRGPFPEASSIADAFIAERARDLAAAARAWRRAIAQAGGTYVADEQFFLARALRASGDSAGAASACDEVLRPRLMSWSFAGAYATCAEWTRASDARLGRP